MPSPTSLELGIFSRTFERKTLAAVLDAVVANGFTQIYLNLKSAGVDPFQASLSAASCDAIRVELEARRLTLVGVSCTFNTIHPDRERRARETAHAARLIMLAPQLGTRFAGLCTGTRDATDMWRAHPANDDPSAWNDLQTTLRSLLEAAASANVTLGIEPEQSNVISSAGRARRLLDELDSELVKIILDPANLLTVSSAEDQAAVIAEALELLAPEIDVVHAKDFSAQGACGAGLGVLDFELLFQLLDRFRVRVPMLLHELPEDGVGRAREFLLAAATRAAADQSLSP